MARSTFTFRFQCSFPEAKHRIESILESKGFRETDLKTGEHVWKNGIGMATAMKFIKVEYAPSSVTLSAWIQAGLGSVGGSEMPLTGFVGFVPKKQLMNVVTEISESLR